MKKLKYFINQMRISLAIAGISRAKSKSHETLNKK